MLDIEIIAHIEERNIEVIIGGGTKIAMEDVIGLMEYLAELETGSTNWGTKDW